MLHIDTRVDMATTLRTEADRQEIHIEKLTLRAAGLAISLRDALDTSQLAELEELLRTERELYNRRGYAEGVRAAADTIDETY